MNKCINTHAISLFVAIITQCIIIYSISDKVCSEGDNASASQVRELVSEYADQVKVSPHLKRDVTTLATE